MWGHLNLKNVSSNHLTPLLYRFGEVMTEQGKPTGWDRVRNQEIGNKDFELDVLEEAFTSEHWIVRIYKVKDLDNRGNK